MSTFDIKKDDLLATGYLRENAVDLVASGSLTQHPATICVQYLYTAPYTFSDEPEMRFHQQRAYFQCSEDNMTAECIKRVGLLDPQLFLAPSIFGDYGMKSNNYPKVSLRLDHVEPVKGTHDHKKATGLNVHNDLETPFDDAESKKIVVDSSKPTTRIQIVFIGGKKATVMVNMSTTVTEMYGHVKALSVRYSLHFEWLSVKSEANDSNLSTLCILRFTSDFNRNASKS